MDPACFLEPDVTASQLAKKVGRRIKAGRLERGLSRRDLGAKVGVSGQQIEKYENGKDAVPLYRLLRLASVYGVPPQSFWGDGDAAPVPSTVPGASDTSALQLIRAYRRIGDSQVRIRLLQLVKQMAGGDEEEFPGP